MEKLVVSGREIGDTQATALSEALDKVKKLNFHHSHITSKGIQAIANQLKKLPDKVRRKTSSGMA